MTHRHDDDLRQLERWLGERRWYGDKTRSLTGAETIFRGTVELDGDAVRLEVRRFSFASGQPTDYLLIVDPHDPGADGVESERVRWWLAASFAEGRSVHSDSGASVRFRQETGVDELASFADLESRVFRGEQSNSSIVYGDVAMLKLFRKLREGVNPEVEIGRFLTRHTGFEAFPKLYGTIELHSGETTTTLGALQQFITSVGDAWTWFTERIVDTPSRGELIAAAQQLGARTGEMHLALASGRDDAFAPERASGAYAQAIRSEAVAELRDTVEQLNQRGVGDAGVLGDALESSLDALQQLEGTMITRVHGDYHLGQVLRTEDDDFAILDFEGEPSRPLAERRAKASPLRDVAGMLRSFDYAAETARRAGQGSTGDIDTWFHEARDAFERGYSETIAGDDVLTQGWDAVSREQVQAAFEVHKALYEARYELNNRPDWLEIPLNALRRIAGIGDPG